MENTLQRDFDIVGDAFMNIFNDSKYRKVFEMNANVGTGNLNNLEIREKTAEQELGAKVFSFTYSFGDNPIGIFPADENNFWTIKVSDNLEDKLREILDEHINKIKNQTN